MGSHILIILGVCLVAGVCVGGAVVWLALRKLSQSAASMAKADAQIEIARLSQRLESTAAGLDQFRAKLHETESRIGELNQQIDTSERERARLEERAGRITRLDSDLETARSDKNKLIAEQEQLRAQIAELKTTLEAERKQSTEKLELLRGAKEELSDRFKSLANDILAENARRFTEQNKENIGQILEPLRTKIGEFQTKVEEVYVQEGKDRSALAEQVKQLMGLNQQLSQDANNLALALKGSNKTQGNWGELVLEKALEDCGLINGSHYQMRPTYKTENGSKLQPDAVVHLPDSKDLIIDAKVSLVAYDVYTSAPDDSDRAAAVKQHIASVRGHINSLADRNYHSIAELKSLDFVVMFIPIEPAFVLAVANDANLWQDAWNKNVLLVSPSSLLFVVRIVANLWRQETQLRSVQEIAKCGAELYDKFVGFVVDLKDLDKRLREARNSYDSACSKLYTGKGNAIRRAERLKELGVKPSKALPPDLLQIAVETSEIMEVDPETEAPN